MIKELLEGKDIKDLIVEECIVKGVPPEDIVRTGRANWLFTKMMELLKEYHQFKDEILDGNVEGAFVDDLGSALSILIDR